MKYLLVIGIEYKFYRKPAYITIHVGNNFIDTFKLEKDFPRATDIVKQIDPKCYKKHGKAHRLTRADWIERWNDIPSLFKVYEIDDSVVDGKLIIKVENSNTDYTNGFMKNNSHIKLPIVALFQKKLIKNRGEKLMDMMLKLDDDVDRHLIMNELIYGVDWRKTNKGLSYPGKQRWYCADVFYMRRKDEMYEKSGTRNFRWHIGGSFTAEFDITKIHATKYVGPVNDVEWARFPRPASACDYVLGSFEQLLNIYDEDQRSNNTKN